MQEKAQSARDKAHQERKRGQHARAIKRLEQAMAAFPDEIDLHLDAVDACLEGGEVAQATRFLKVAQERFTLEKERLAAFVRDKLAATHDPAFARFVVENSIKLRDLVTALDLLARIPDLAVRDLLARTRTKKQSLKSASHGGYSLRGELLTNEILSALLSLRVGNLKEAVSAIVQILDEKPVEHEIFLPFLLALQSQHGKSGRVRFAYACAQCASGTELEAVGQFVEAARLEPPVAALCADRLRVLRETTKARTRITRALAEVLLIQGDMEGAAEVLREYLADVPETGREVMLLLRPYLNPDGGMNACTRLALDASLTLEQSNAALEILRPLHRLGRHGAEMLAWFEDHAADTVLTPDMMIMHATLALDEKRHARAAEILRRVCETSPPDVPAVVGMLDRVRNQHPDLEKLHGEFAAADTPANEDRGVDDGDYQMFDNREFQLPRSGEAPAATGPNPGASDAQKPLGFADRMKKKIKKGAFIETREISFDEEDTTDGATGPGDCPGDEMPGESVAETPGVGTTSEITEAHVVNVAQKLYEAGAAVFFHVDGDDAPAAPATDTAAADAPTPPSFDDSFAAFKQGTLGNSEIIVLLERAVAERRVNEMQDLLCFTPENDRENFWRRYYQAEQLNLSSRPLQAIQVLQRLDLPGLDDSQKQQLWLRLASYQRQVRDFAAANETLTRLVDAYPDREEFSRLARTNYEQYLGDQCQEAIALEKTSSLD